MRNLIRKIKNIITSVLSTLGLRLTDDEVRGDYITQIAEELYVRHNMTPFQALRKAEEFYDEIVDYFHDGRDE